jgi:hypothetical protein
LSRRKALHEKIGWEIRLMRRRLIWLVGVLLLVAPWAYPVGRVSPFRLRVVDQLTGHGLPGLRVTTETAGIDYTRYDGSVVFWLSNDLKDRPVRFTIEHHGVVTEMRLLITPGGVESVAVTAP